MAAGGGTSRGGPIAMGFLYFLYLWIDFSDGFGNIKLPLGHRVTAQRKEWVFYMCFNFDCSSLFALLCQLFGFGC